MLIGSEDAAQAFVAERCNGKDFERLTRFVPRLLAANSVQNLISQSSATTIWARHVADSAQLLDHVPRGTQPWVDLGTGAGFPGVVLAIMRPAAKFVLVESRKLRVQWLLETIQSLDIRNCDVIGTDVGSARGFEAAAISARAFAPLDRLLALSARFSTISTRWVLPKGRSAAKEVSALPSNLRSMFHVERSVTDLEAGIIVGTGRVEIAA